jgi:hypothetical protein
MMRSQFKTDQTHSEHGDPVRISAFAAVREPGNTRMSHPQRFKRMTALR